MADDIFDPVDVFGILLVVDFVPLLDLAEQLVVHRVRISDEGRQTTDGEDFLQSLRKPGEVIHRAESTEAHAHDRPLLLLFRKV